MAGHHPAIEEIEAAFIARRKGPPDLHGAFRDALAVAAPGGSPALRRAGTALADAADRWPGPVLPYHDRHHFAEAALSAGWLCRLAAEAGFLPHREAGLGALAMLGHDLYHDGSVKPPGVHEAHSWAAMASLVAAAGLADADMAVLETIVLATDPGRVAANHAALALEPGPLTLLCVLANEADICASMLPALGPRLGLLLGLEHENAGETALARTFGYAGRADFLCRYPCFSAAGTALGLTLARQRSVAALETAGQMLAADATARAGGAALDRLAPGDAEAAYHAALMRVLPRRPEARA